MGSETLQNLEITSDAKVSDPNSGAGDLAKTLKYQTKPRYPTPSLGSDTLQTLGNIRRNAGEEGGTQKANDTIPTWARCGNGITHTFARRRNRAKLMHRNHAEFEFTYRGQVLIDEGE
jgi:hypothetical protein